MTTAIAFGEYDDAQTFRDNHAEHLAAADDGRFKTVVLADDVPTDVLEEAEMLAAADDGKGVTDGDPETFDAEGPCGDLSRQQLGRLRRAWGAYIGGMRQAVENFNTVNEIRSGVCLSPLDFGDLTGSPQDVTAALLDDLDATDGVVPEEMTAEELVEAAHNAETPGTVASDGGTTTERVTQSDAGEGTLTAATERALAADVSINPDEAFRGVGAAGTAASDLDSALSAEDATDRQRIASDLSDAAGGDADLADAVDGAEMTPPGNLDSESDLDGHNGWRYSSREHESVDVLHHPDVRPKREDLGDPRASGIIRDQYAVLEITKMGGSFSGMGRSRETFRVSYQEKNVVEPEDGSPERTVMEDRKRVAEDLPDREAALKEAWRFAALSPTERDSPVVAQYDDLAEQWGRRFPESVGAFTLTDSAPDGAVGWMAPAPAKARRDQPEFSTVLVTVSAEGYRADPETAEEWTVGTYRLAPDGRTAEMDGSAYKKNVSGKSWGKALKLAASHMRKLSDMDGIGEGYDVLPQFRIETELRVLKPLLNAAKRAEAKYDKNGEVLSKLEVAEDGLHITAPATTGNVAAIAEIDVDTDDLDTYQVGETGTAYVDAEQLWRHFTDAGLTSTLTLTLEERSLHAPPRVNVQIDGEDVTISDPSRPVDDLDTHLIPEETALRYGGVDLPDFDTLHGGSVEVPALTSALDDVDTGAFWLLCGSQRVGVAAKSADGMTTQDTYRVGTSDPETDNGSVLFTTDLWRDLLRAVPRQSGKVARVDYGAGDPDPGHVGDGPCTAEVDVGESTLAYLISPRVGADDDQSDVSVPLGYGASRTSDVIPREVHE